MAIGAFQQIRRQSSWATAREKTAEMGSPVFLSHAHDGHENLGPVLGLLAKNGPKPYVDTLHLELASTSSMTTSSARRSGARISTSTLTRSTAPSPVLRSVHQPVAGVILQGENTSLGESNEQSARP
jgi:hypothetical protein